MDIQKLLKQAQQMQGNLKKAEGELAARQYSGEASGGAVSVVVKGSYEVASIHVEDELMDKENKEMMLDLIMIAMNQAFEKAKEDREALLGSLTGGISLPGM